MKNKKLSSVEKDITFEENEKNFVALIGNPNSGKTTIFNYLTGLNQKVGNFTGVTVEKKFGILSAGKSDKNQKHLEKAEDVTIIDLPGAYSLSVYSPDEAIVQSVLSGKDEDCGKLAGIVFVLDVSCLERSLYLVLQAMEMELPMIVVLNMFDQLEKRGLRLQIEKLEQLLGLEIICCQANKNIGLDKLKDRILQRKFSKPHKPIVPFSENELRAIKGVQTVVEVCERKANFGMIYLWLSCASLLDSIDCHKIRIAIEHWRFWLDRESPNWQSERIITRYKKIDLICENCFDRIEKSSGKYVCESLNKKWEDRLDSILLHKVFGWVFLLSILGIFFWSIFNVSFYPVNWLNQNVQNISDFIASKMTEGQWKSLVIDGIFAGVGSVVIFLPQVLLLFFFLGFLESTGYLPRIAFLLDRWARKFGLPGQAFIPLLMCYACTVPGVLGTRSLNVNQERLSTIFIAPCISCSARLPIYLLLISIMDGSVGPFAKTIILMSIYMFGTFVALEISNLLRKRVFAGDSQGVIMEMPKYRLPALKNIVYQMLENTWVFLSKVGSIVLLFSVLFWGLMHFPYNSQLNKKENLENSFAGKIGRFIEPVIKPLGYDWKIGIGLLSSLGARESFISTMSVLYHSEETNDRLPTSKTTFANHKTESLNELFNKQKDSNGKILYNIPTCLSLLIFFALALQCAGTVAVVKRETNSWGFALFQLFFINLIAYVASFLVFQISKLIFV